MIFNRKFSFVHYCIRFILYPRGYRSNEFCLSIYKHKSNTEINYLTTKLDVQTIRILLFTYNRKIRIRTN